MRPLVSALALGAACCCRFFGQTAAPERLTLREAIEIGLRPGRRADIALAGEAVARAESVARASKLALYPQLDARLSGGERSVNLGAQGFGGRGSGSGLAIPLNPSFTTFDARPVVTMNLLSLAQWKNWRIARQDASRAGRERESAMDNAAVLIARQYLACLQAEAEVHAAEADVKLSRDLLTAAEERLRAGAATAVDVTRARAQEALDRSGLIQQKHAVLEARAGLFHAIGLEHSETIELEPLPGRAPPLPPLGEALAAAAIHRTDLALGEQAVAVAGEKAKAIEWERLPSLAGSFDLGRNGTGMTNNDWTRTGTATLSLTLLDFGRRRERQTQAGIAVREQQIRLLDLRREIQRQVRVAAGKVEAARAQLEAAQAERQLTSLQIDQVRVRLAEGLATGLDVTEAQTRFARSARTLLQAEYGVRLAEMELLGATGQLRQWVQENR